MAIWGMLTLCFLCTNIPIECSVSVTEWELVLQDVWPSTAPLSTTNTPTPLHCFMSCLKIETCASLAFAKPNHCELFGDQLTAENENLMERPDSTYYHAYRGGKHAQKKVAQKPKRYKIVNESKSFDDAQKECQKTGGSLACIADEQTQKNVEKFIHNSNTSVRWLWIGIEAPASSLASVKENHTSSEFTHCVDGTVLQGFSWWRPVKQPNNWLSQRVGVEIVSRVSDDQFGRWYDENAEFEFPFLCEYSDENLN